MTTKNATFRVKVISGSRITIPTSVRRLLGVRDGDYIVCSVRATETEELPPLKTLWRILDACRKARTNKEIAKRCRLSARATKSHLALLVEEELLSANRARESDAGEETYRTTEKGLQIINLVAATRGSPK